MTENFPTMREPFDRQSTTDQVGLKPMSRMQTPDSNTGMVPIALPDAPLPVNLNDGGSRSIQPGVGETGQNDGADKGFVANDGCKNP